MAEEASITTEDMQSLSDKLEAFSAELSPVERAALIGVIGAAEDGGGDDVSGFAHGQMGKIQGLDKVPGSINIGKGIPGNDPLEAVAVSVGGLCVTGEWSR